MSAEFQAFYPSGCVRSWDQQISQEARYEQKNDRTPQKLRKDIYRRQTRPKRRPQASSKEWETEYGSFCIFLTEWIGKLGIVHDWKDKGEAEDMQMSQATLKRQRQELGRSWLHQL